MSSAAPAPLCCSPLATAPLSEPDAEELAAVLRALADPVRLRLVSLIHASASDEMCACDLPALVDRKQSTVSHHLSQLVKAGLINREQRGKWAWFTINDDRFATLCSVLDTRCC